MTSFREKAATIGTSLAELGFEPARATGHFAWHGRWNDRDCIVRVSPLRRTGYAGEVRYRTTLGYQLRVELESDIRTFLSFVRRSFTRNFVIRQVYKWRKQAVLHDMPPALADFPAVTIDVDWSRRFLAESDAIADVAALINEDAAPAYAGSVYFMPTSRMGKLYYGSPILALDKITPERTKAVLERMDRIASAAERLPAPQVEKKAGTIGRFAEKHPWATAAAVLFVPLAVLGCAALIFATLLILAAAIRR